MRQHPDPKQLVERLAEYEAKERAAKERRLDQLEHRVGELEAQVNHGESSISSRLGRLDGADGSLVRVREVSERALGRVNWTVGVVIAVVLSTITAAVIKGIWG